MSAHAFRLNEVVMVEGMGSEPFEVVGVNLPERSLLLHGDWSQYGHSPVSSWHPMDGVFHTRLVIDTSL